MTTSGPLEELPVIDGLHAYDDIQLFPELFDTLAVIERITSKANLIEKQLNKSGMYPLPQTPLPCTSGFIPRPSSTFRPITPAAPSPATGTAKPHQTQQSQETSPGSSLPCGQGTPTAPTDSQPPVQPDGSTTSQGIPTNNSPVHSQFTPQGVTPQKSPIEQQSPIRTQTNPLSQNSIPAPEATVPDTPEEKIPKSLNGDGVNNSRKQATTSTTNTQDSRLCFRCKQPGHLKKDCPQLPYHSKCRTQGHIPAKCPTKKQDNRWQDERCENADKRCKTYRKDWKKAQDRPQFSNRTNKCLNCAGDHRTHYCPTRQQPHTPPVGNPANGTGIYKNNSQSQIIPHQQHSQQSTYTMSISTPSLMVNSPLQTGPQQGQQQHSPPKIPPANQPANSPIRHNQFNQQFQQPPMPQVSQLMAPPQQFNPQIPPLYFHHYPPTNSPSVDSNESLLKRVFHRQMDMAERQEKHDQEREEREKCKEECKKQEKREAN